MTLYVGILDGSGKTYGVRIPDLPGCYGAGKTAEAALTDAMSAAREWLAHRASKGEAAPKARDILKIATEAAEAGTAKTLLQVFLLPPIA